MSGNAAGQEIFVVDDDRAVREALSLLLSAGGFEPICFTDGEAMLAVARTRKPACILLDVNLPGKSGLDILKELHAEDYAAPILMISGGGDIAMAVSAVKSGARDFIEKPFRGAEIMTRIEAAIASVKDRPGSGWQTKVPSLEFPNCEPLSPREREVLDLFSSGKSNKEAGLQLGLSPRTIEYHRANIMKKIGARRATDLLRIVINASTKV